MPSKTLRIIFGIGVLLITRLVMDLTGVLFSSVPDAIRRASLNIYSMLYRLIPLVMLLFFSPIILYCSRRPDIDILFELRGDGNLEIIIRNRGDVPFSFNRVQFYVKN